MVAVYSSNDLVRVPTGYCVCCRVIRLVLAWRPPAHAVRARTVTGSLRSWHLSYTCVFWRAVCHITNPRGVLATATCCNRVPAPGDVRRCVRAATGQPPPLTLHTHIFCFAVVAIASQTLSLATRSLPPLTAPGVQVRGAYHHLHPLPRALCRDAYRLPVGVVECMRRRVCAWLALRPRRLLCLRTLLSVRLAHTAMIAPPVRRSGCRARGSALDFLLVHPERGRRATRWKRAFSESCCFACAAPGLPTVSR
jgi:hypothetical protein